MAVIPLIVAAYGGLHPHVNTLLKQLASDVEADSPHGYDPAAKPAFHCLGLYELSTALWMGNADMVLNIPQGVHVSRRRNSTCEAAEWRATHPMPSIMPRPAQGTTTLAAWSETRPAPLQPMVLCSDDTSAPIPAISRRQGATGAGVDGRTTTQHSPPLSGQHDISPAVTLGPAPDLTSAFINSSEMDVAEIETSVLGRNSANREHHMFNQFVSSAKSRHSKRPSSNVVSGSESYVSFV